MKKFMTISILLIYVASVFFIALFGVEVSSYQPTIYIESIEFEYEFPIKEPDVINVFESGDYINIYFEYIEFDENEEDNPNVILLYPIEVFPTNATNRSISINQSSSNKEGALEIEVSNLIFNHPENAASTENLIIHISSNDGSGIRRSIRFIVSY